MTGYGEARTAGDGFELAVELKSLNNRFLKVASKLSDEVSYLQNDIEEEVRRHVERGSIFVTIYFRPTRFTDLYEIDEQVLRKYLSRLKRLRGVLGDGAEIPLRDLLLLPGVVHSEENVLLGKQVVLPAALRGLRAALKDMVAMRAREGRNLERDFHARAKNLRRLLRSVADHAPQAVADYQKRLGERVNRLLADRDLALSPQDLAKEAAILAERSDI